MRIHEIDGGMFAANMKKAWSITINVLHGIRDFGVGFGTGVFLGTAHC